MSCPKCGAPVPPNAGFCKTCSAPIGLRLVRDERPAAREVAASPGWPPVAIPGRPGWWRHYIDGQQVDLSTNNSQD